MNMLQIGLLKITLYLDQMSHLSCNTQKYNIDSAHEIKFN